MEDEGPAVPLGVGDVARIPHETAEPGVGDGAGVDAEGTDDYLPGRPLAVGGVAQSVVGTHDEFPARKQDHAIIAAIGAGDRGGNRGWPFRGRRTSRGATGGVGTGGDGVHAPDSRQYPWKGQTAAATGIRQSAEGSQAWVGAEGRGAGCNARVSARRATAFISPLNIHPCRG